MARERTIQLVEDAQGRKLLVEVTHEAEVTKAPAASSIGDEFRPVGAREKVEHFTNTLTGLISDTTEAIIDGIEQISRPSKVQIEFGVELSAEGSVWFIAKGSVNSTIKVSIEWEKLGKAAEKDKSQPQN